MQAGNSKRVPSEYVIGHPCVYVYRERQQRKRVREREQGDRNHIYIYIYAGRLCAHIRICCGSGRTFVLWGCARSGSRHTHRHCARHIPAARAHVPEVYICIYIPITHAGGEEQWRAASGMHIYIASLRANSRSPTPSGASLSLFPHASKKLRQRIIYAARVLSPIYMRERCAHPRSFAQTRLEYIGGGIRSFDALCSLRRSPSLSLSFSHLSLPRSRPAVIQAIIHILYLRFGNAQKSSRERECGVRFLLLSPSREGWK